MSCMPLSLSILPICFLLDLYAFLSSSTTFVFWPSYIVKYLALGQAFPSWNCSSYFFHSILFGNDLTCRQTLSKRCLKQTKGHLDRLWSQTEISHAFPLNLGGETHALSSLKVAQCVLPEATTSLTTHLCTYFFPAFLHMLTEVSFPWSESLSLCCLMGQFSKVFNMFSLCWRLRFKHRNLQCSAA